MTVFRIKLAEKTIEISSLYDEVHTLCKDYITDDEAEIKISVTQYDIDREREKTEKANGSGIIYASDSYLETLAVYRKISDMMPAYDTFLFHGSCIAVDGSAYIFTAKSGTGKSTHAKLWRNMLGEKAVMVNDDKPLIRANDKGVIVFGTPYNGKHRLGANIAVPLRAVCILERAKENSIKKIGTAEAYPELLRQSYRPSSPEMLKKTLDIIDCLAERVSFYRLGANMDPEAAEIAYSAMKPETLI